MIRLLYRLSLLIGSGDARADKRATDTLTAAPAREGEP